MSYETNWLNRDQIVDISYEAGKRLSKIKYDYGLLDKTEYEDILIRIELAKGLIQRIDEIYPNPDHSECWDKLIDLELNMDRHSIATINKKSEIKWPVLRNKFKIMNIVKAVLFE